MKKRITALALAFAMVLGTVAIAAGTEKSISVTPMSLTVNGRAVTPTKSDGAAAEVFAYNGATYVPLRYLAELLGIQVDWSAENSGVAKLEGDNLKIPTSNGADGIYTASAQGFGGEVTATITVTGGKITACVLTGDRETPGIGGAAIEKLGPAIAAAGGMVDGISGATATSSAVRAAVEQAMIAAGLKNEQDVKMKAGTYSGSAHGFNAKAYITVSVTVDESSIKDIQLQNDFTSYEETDTKALAEFAFEGMVPQMIAHQSLAVDAVSGATGSSNGVRQAVANALKKALVAGGNDENDVSCFYRSVEKTSGEVIKEGYDLIIVGAGGGGMTAALQSVAEPGMKTLVVEKAGFWGGTSMLTSGPVAYSVDITESELDAGVARFLRGNGQGMCPGGLYSLRHGDDAVWNDTSYVSAHAGEYTDVNTSALREIFRASGLTVKLLMDNGFKFCLGYTPEPVTSVDQFTHDDGATMVSYSADGGPRKAATPYYYSAAKKTFENAGGECLMNTTVDKLLYDGDKIVGVEGHGADGRTYKLYGENVILATGGYGANAELMERFTGDNWGLIGAPNQGEGTLMALEAGGNPYNLDAYPMLHQRGPAVFMRTFEAEEYKGTTWSPNDIPHVMALSKDGVYVTDEGRAFDVSAFRWANGEGTAYLGSTYYAMYSAEMIEQYKEKGMTDVTLGRYFGQFGVIAEMPLANIETVLQAGVEQGYIYKVSSLVEAEKLLGLPSGSASAAYKQFGKGVQNAESKYYYIVTGKGYGYSSCGGVEVNGNMQVVKTDGNVIENLFLVGTDSLGNIMTTGAEYPTGGDAHIWTQAGGYIAAKQARENVGK